MLERLCRGEQYQVCCHGPAVDFPTQDGHVPEINSARRAVRLPLGLLDLCPSSWYTYADFVSYLLRGVHPRVYLSL